MKKNTNLTKHDMLYQWEDIYHWISEKKTNELLKNGCIVNFMTCLFSHKSLWIKLNGIVYLPPAEKYLFLGNAKK